MILSGYTEVLLQDHIHFQPLLRLSHLITHCIFIKICWEKYREQSQSSMKKSNIKLQYDINGVTAKISALPSSKTDKYEGEDILPSQQLRIIQEAKFFIHLLGRYWKKEQKKLIIMIKIMP